MPLAVLSIDLEAKLAKLMQGMDQAYSVVERNTDRMAAAFDASKKAAAALAATVGTAALAGWIRTTIDGVDALNDFADAVGTTVENASALEDAALRTGTALEVAEAAALKLNKTLADAKPGTDQARLLESIGLSAQELRRIDPAEALLQVATALDRYQNSGSKARLIQELFGKSAKEVAPFLKDLAEQGRLNATVTREQADQAERFNKHLAQLRKDADDAARSLAGTLLPALTRYLAELRAGQQVYGGTLSAFFNVGLNEPTGDPIERLTALRAELSKLKADQKDLADQRGPDWLLMRAAGSSVIERRIPEVQKLISYYETVLRLQGQVVGGRPANEGGGRFLGISAPELPAVGPKDMTKAFDKTGITEAMAGALRAIEQTDVAKIAALNSQLDALFEIRAGGACSGPEVDVAIQRLRDELEKLQKVVSQGDPLGEFINRLNQEGMNDTLATIGRSKGAQQDALVRRTEDLSEAFRKGNITAEDFARGAQVLGEEWEALAGRTQRVDDITKDLGLTFSSALEDALISGQKFGDLLKSLEQDLLRLVTRKLITEPLAGNITGFLQGITGGSGSGGGFDFGKLAGDWIKGLFTGRYAEGGFIPPGKWGMVGERGPEPAFGGRTGLTVRPAGSGSVVQNISFMLSGPVDQRTQGQIAALTARAVERASSRNN